MTTTTEPGDLPPASRRRGPVLLAAAGVAVVVVAVVVAALVTGLVTAANARAAARTAEAEEDAAALLRAHGAAMAAAQELSDVVALAGRADAEVLTPLREIVAHETLAGLDPSALDAATDVVRSRRDAVDERAPVPALEAPTEFAEEVGPDAPAEWTEALAAAYRSLPDRERSDVRAAVARSVDELETRAAGDVTDAAVLASTLDDARAAVDALVAAAAARAPELAIAAELAPEELLVAVVAAGEALGEGPGGPAAVEHLRTLVAAVEVANAAHAAEQAAREEAEREQAERARST